MPHLGNFNFGDTGFDLGLRLPGLSNQGPVANPQFGGGGGGTNFNFGDTGFDLGLRLPGISTQLPVANQDIISQALGANLPLQPFANQPSGNIPGGDLGLPVRRQTTTQRRRPPPRRRTRAQAQQERPQQQSRGFSDLQSISRQVFANQQANFARQQALASQQRQALSRTSAQLGQFVDRAIGQEFDINRQAQAPLRALLAQSENDPTSRLLEQSLISGLGGLPQSVLDSIQGATAARSAASQAATGRSARARAGAGGVSGQQLANQLLGIRQRSGAALNRQLSGNEAQFQIASRQAQSQTQQQLGQFIDRRFGRRAGIASQLSSIIGRISPLDLLQRGQQITNPLAAFGQSLALGGGGGGGAGFPGGTFGSGII